MSENAPKTDKSWISEGLLIAAVPLLGYLIGFLYELGYCSVFGIPYQFILLNITNVLNGSLILIGFLLSFFYYLNNIYTDVFFEKTKSNPVWKIIFLLSFFWMFFLGLFFIYGPLWKELAVYFIAFIFVTLYAFIEPLVQKGKNYREKINASFNNKSELPLLFLNLNKKIGKSLTITIIILLFAYNLGRATALKQKDFLIIDTSPKEVLLRIYDNKIILAPLNENKLKKIFIVRELSNQNVSLRLEKIGPLQMEK